MLINRLKGLFATLALGYLAACATPCGAPGRLCAPQVANTSERQVLHARAMPAIPTQAAPPAPPPAAPASTSPVRIALLVPLKSATLSLPAEAVRDGFLAAHERDRDGVEVDVIATGDSLADVLEAYAKASADHDIVVGPLARAAVGAVAQGPAVTRPTIALNHPETGIALPARMLSIGLSIEDEARQAADWAAREHPEGRALILAGSEAWQRRMAQAFEARWGELGRNSHLADVTVEGGQVDPEAIAVVRTRIEVEPPELVFAALDAGQLRQVRGVLGTGIVCYAASPANPGRVPGDPVTELDGLRLLDVPWEVQPDHQAVMVYPRWVATGHTLDMDRLYALGIDAFRLAHAIALHPGAPLQLDGVTGKLAASFDQPATFQRTEAAVVYRNGGFEMAAGLPPEER
jgi:outer membrane PBP1 activator LpoA protein